jgi:glutamate synthase (NADPH/NADH) small chain
MAAEGVKFMANTAVGIHVSGSQLKREYDAIVLCCGATKPRDLPIPGRKLKGIHFAMEFLQSNTKSFLDSAHKDGKYISAKAKDVIVVGGGDTGTDCVGTAMRHGCKSLTQLEILPRPADERQPDNPWPEWPKVYRLDYGQEEAQARFGADPRVYLTTGEKFVGDESGHVKEMHIYDVEWARNNNGAFIPKRVPGSDRILKADLVLLAMGFLGPEEGLLVVWAINEGRGAARECDRFLMGETNLP